MSQLSATSLEAILGDAIENFFIVVTKCRPVCDYTVSGDGEADWCVTDGSSQGMAGRNICCPYVQGSL